MIDFKELTKPFEVDDIQWRIGATNQGKTSGLALAYVDTRAVMDRLDSVCGPENWANRYTHADKKTVCEIGINITQQIGRAENDNWDMLSEWVWKADGAGDTETEADKGALSDAFKRAAVRWGIGKYLYGKQFKNIWVEIEPAGKSHKIKKFEYAKLEAILRGEKVRTSIVEMGEASAVFKLSEPGSSNFCEFPTWDGYLLALGNLIRENGNYYQANKSQVDFIEIHYPTRYSEKHKLTAAQWCQKIRKFGEANVSGVK